METQEKAAHTPGPWQIGDNGHNANQITTVARGKGRDREWAAKRICIIGRIYQNVSVAELEADTREDQQIGLADARLIANAPALAKLAARIKACYECKYTMDAMWHEFGDVLCAAARLESGDFGPDEQACLDAFCKQA